MRGPGRCSNLVGKMLTQQVASWAKFWKLHFSRNSRLAELKRPGCGGEMWTERHESSDEIHIAPISPVSTEYIVQICGAILCAKKLHLYMLHSSDCPRPLQWRGPGRCSNLVKKVLTWLFSGPNPRRYVEKTCPFRQIPRLGQKGVVWKKVGGGFHKPYSSDQSDCKQDTCRNSITEQFGVKRLHSYLLHSGDRPRPLLPLLIRWPINRSNRFSDFLRLDRLDRFAKIIKSIFSKF